MKDSSSLVLRLTEYLRGEYELLPISDYGKMQNFKLKSLISLPYSTSPLHPTQTFPAMESFQAFSFEEFCQNTRFQPDFISQAAMILFVTFIQGV